MSIGLPKRNSIIGLMEEVTEGTYVVPAATTDYIEIEPDFSVKISRDEKAREFINASIGEAKPLLGMKSAEASFSFEARSGGDGGVVSDYDSIFKSALGTKTTRVDKVTSGTGSTTTVINVGAGTGADFAVGDMIYIKKGSGNSAVRFVSSISTDALTIAPALAAGEVPGNAVTISGAVTYKPANTGHVPLSLSVYWANDIREAVLGCKVSKLSVAGWSVGEIAKWSCTLMGLTYTRIDGAAPHTPAYVAQTPPIVLSATIFQDSTAIQIKDFSLEVENTVQKAVDQTDSNGAYKSFLMKRKVTGSINPYLDGTSVANFTSFNAATDFALMVVIGNVDANGDYVEGSITGIYMPNCMFTENAIGDDGGLLQENLKFKAHRDDEGGVNEIYIGHG
jgi:hypothetical protein